MVNGDESLESSDSEKSINGKSSLTKAKAKTTEIDEVNKYEAETKKDVVKGVDDKKDAKDEQDETSTTDDATQVWHLFDL